MEHTYEELGNKTVAQLREMAKGIENEALRGYSTMHKEQLLQALCKALTIDAREHHEVVGVDKGRIKAQIRKLKVARDAALEAHDHGQLKMIRRKVHGLKRRVRKATV
jgi:DNA polymerase/3'-5' exonuclease PolX